MVRTNISAFGMAALAAVILACPVSAATIRKAADGLPLQPVLDRASPMRAGGAGVGSNA